MIKMQLCAYNIFMINITLSLRLQKLSSTDQPHLLFVNEHFRQTY